VTLLYIHFTVKIRYLQSKREYSRHPKDKLKFKSKPGFIKPPSFETETRTEDLNYLSRKELSLNWNQDGELW
jgi:hypothetical protein